MSSCTRARGGCTSAPSTVFPNGVTHDMRYSAPFPHLRRPRRRAAASGTSTATRSSTYVMGHGALLLGHNYPADRGRGRARNWRRARTTARRTSWRSAGASWCSGSCLRSERVRFTSSGTEATMMALRLARAFTGREKMLRLREHFHGWNDSVDGAAGGGGDAAALAGPAARHPRRVDRDPAERRRRAASRRCASDGDEIAAMILEPTGAHWGTEPIGHRLRAPRARADARARRRADLRRGDHGLPRVARAARRRRTASRRT